MKIKKESKKSIGENRDYRPGTSLASSNETEAYKRLAELLTKTEVPPNEVLANLQLWMPRSALSRTLFMYEIYTKQLHTHGQIFEFGVRWGQNLALLTTLRTILEPHNLTRRVIGFDTFSGFPSVSAEDGNAAAVVQGAMSVAPSHESALSELLTLHERLAPRANIKKFELVKGDVRETLPTWLEAHPETLISMAYFDLDLYEPTKVCLELIQPYLAENSILAFDELASVEFPGETRALREVFGSKGYKIMRCPISPYQSYATLT